MVVVEEIQEASLVGDRLVVVVVVVEAFQGVPRHVTVQEGHLDLERGLQLRPEAVDTVLGMPFVVIE